MSNHAVASSLVSIGFFWYFLVTVVPCHGSSWRTPNTYLTAGIRRGTATTSSTTTGTTSVDLPDGVVKAINAIPSGWSAPAITPGTRATSPARNLEATASNC